MIRMVAGMVLGTVLFCGCINSDIDNHRLLLAGGIHDRFYGGIPVNEEFDFTWDGSDSPDGLWRRSSWVATGGNLFTWDNAITLPSYTGATGGVLQLTVQAGILQGGELQTVGEHGGDFGYGYYEVRMKVTSVPGCCVSFFWIQAPDYGPEEIDIEFLTNESWTTGSGTVHYTIHPDWEGNDTAVTQTLDFNPSADFHRYGFLRTWNRISYTVDGIVVRTFTHPPCNNIARQKGYIMMNAWTGNANWGGGPPAEDAVSVYDWVKFFPGATSVPLD